MRKPSGAFQSESLAALPGEPSGLPHLTSSAASHRVQQIEAEKVKLLYTQAPIGFVVTVLNAGVVVFILWGSVASSLLIAWLVLIVTITLLRFALVQRYRRAAATADQVRSWRTLFILGWCTKRVGSREKNSHRDPLFSCLTRLIGLFSN